MNAAATVFARRGLSGTKISDIADAAAMSQGLVYRYFRSKDELFAILVTRALDGAVGLAERALGRPSPLEGLRWLVGQMLAGMEHQPEGFLLVLHAFASEAVPQSMQDEALAKGQRVREVVRTLVADGQAAEELGAGDPDELAGVLLACIQGLAAAAAFPSSWRPVLPSADTVLRFLEPLGGGEAGGTGRAAEGSTGSLRPTQIRGSSQGH